MAICILYLYLWCNDYGSTSYCCFRSNESLSPIRLHMNLESLISITCISIYSMSVFNLFIQSSLSFILSNPIFYCSIILLFIFSIFLNIFKSSSNFQFIIIYIIKYQYIYLYIYIYIYNVNPLFFTCFC